MSTPRQVEVHLLPHLVTPEHLQGGVAAVIDVLRATTTIVHALAAGCTSVIPVAEVDEARRKAAELEGRVLLGGERGGQPIAGFQLGNSPGEYTPLVCQGSTLVFTTTNGTRALLQSAAAERSLLAAFVNFSAVCEQLLKETRPIHLICAGTRDEVTLEDALLAGALVEVLCQGTCQPPPQRARKSVSKPAERNIVLNDSARLAWDCFEHHGLVLEQAFRLSRGGLHLASLGYEADLTAAAAIDQFMLVPELRRDPLRVEVGAIGMVRRRWPAGS
jgi:2-phosphosulfolactate phosphatase